jgi:choline dehydrogenase-like flavoprotein
MLKDFRDFPDQTDIETDLCIVGSGAAGIAIAREFLQQTQLDVLLLESGGIKPDVATNHLNAATSIGYFHDGAMDGRNRALGGATQLWAGQCIRMDAIDFEARPWIEHSGWPITLQDLDPFYRRAEAFFDLDHPTYGEKIWEPFGIRPPAVNPKHLFYKSTVWCPEIDMGKLYRRELESSAHITVLLNATVTKLHSNPTRSQVESLSLQTLAGKRGKVRAKWFILACGGIENARLLLLSDGLGNDQDLVGRFFQEHPNTECASIATTQPRSLQDPLALLYDRKTKVRYLPRLCLNPDIQKEKQVLNSVCYLVFEFPEQSAVIAAKSLYQSFKQGKAPDTLTQDLKTLVLESPDILNLLYRRYLKGLSAGTRPQRIWVHAHLEQAPNPSSRITLSAERDALGLPLPCIDWRLTELEKRTTQIIGETVKAEFEQLNLGQVTLADWLSQAGGDWSQVFGDSYHHIGTTRMADHPQRGVVTADCQVHGISNLFMAGSSVFPTGSYANPTLTLVALALRLSDHLKVSVQNR